MDFVRLLVHQVDRRPRCLRPEHRLRHEGNANRLRGGRRTSQGKKFALRYGFKTLGHYRQNWLSSLVALIPLASRRDPLPPSSPPFSPLNFFSPYSVVDDQDVGMRGEFRPSRGEDLGFGDGFGRAARNDRSRRWQNPLPRRRHRAGGVGRSRKEGKENLAGSESRKLPASKGGA